MNLLLKTPLNDKAKNLVGLIRRSVNRMSGLIDNVMDFTRGRLGGGFVLNRSATEPLEPLLRQIVEELQTVTPDRRIEASFELTESIDCDPARIGQLVSNLLGNALNHGRAEQPVRLRAATLNGGFELSVANSGDPIPPELLPHIFEPYTRGRHSPSQQGLGLGLYISNEIAKAHGGRLDVETSEHETRFTFRAPLNR